MESFVLRCSSNSSTPLLNGLTKERFIKSFVYQGKHREIDTMPKALRAQLDEHFNSRYVVVNTPSGVQAPQ